MSRLKAVVYRDARTAEGTAEAVAALLESCPQHFTTSFIGPDEDLDITPSNLKDVTIYAQPGGPGILMPARLTSPPHLSLPYLVPTTTYISY